jgi:hypothetical protein
VSTAQTEPEINEKDPAIRGIIFPCDFFQRRSVLRLIPKYDRTVEWWLALVFVAREACEDGRLTAGRELLTIDDLQLIHRGGAIPLSFLESLVELGMLDQDEDGCYYIPNWSQWHRDKHRPPSKSRKAERERSALRRQKTGRPQLDRTPTAGDRCSTAGDRKKPQPPTDPILSVTQPIHNTTDPGGAGGASPLALQPDPTEPTDDPTGDQAEPSQAGGIPPETPAGGHPQLPPEGDSLSLSGDEGNPEPAAEPKFQPTPDLGVIAAGRKLAMRLGDHKSIKPNDDKRLLEWYWTNLGLPTRRGVVKIQDLEAALTFGLAVAEHGIAKGEVGAKWPFLLGAASKSLPDIVDRRLDRDRAIAGGLSDPGPLKFVPKGDQR